MGLNHYLLLVLAISILHSGVYAHKNNPALEEIRLALEGNDAAFEHSKRDTTGIVTIPSVIAHSSDTVTVQLSGVPKPSGTDIIALYTPANADPKKTSPIDIMHAREFDGYETYSKTGKASAKMKVMNMHQDVAFILYRNGSSFFDTGNKYLVFVAKSNVATFAKPNEPTQGHLSLTGKAGEMKVQWVSGTSAKGQSVKIGVTPGQYLRTESATSKTYSASDLCGYPATSWGYKSPGLLFSTVIDSLSAGKKYYYIYGSEADGWSKESYFLGPSFSPKRTVNFIALADLGFDGRRSRWNEVTPLTTTVERVISQTSQNDFVLIGGDLSYAMGYLFYWDLYFDLIAPSATRIPWMSVIGNHELGSPKSFYPMPDSGGECGIPYERKMAMPAAAGTPWYSYNYGPVHIVVISTEHDFNVGSEQLNWLKKNLASVDRKVYPWVIVNGHRSIFSIGSNGGFMRARLGKVLDQYKVTVYLAGHVHNYQRFCPVTYTGVCKSGSPIHVTVGMAGYDTQTYTGSIWKNQIKKNLGAGYSGFTKITASTTVLKLSFIEASTDKVLDSFTVNRPAASSKAAQSANGAGETDSEDPSLGEPVADDGEDVFDAPEDPETQTVAETEDPDTLVTDNDMETEADETLGENFGEFIVDLDETSRTALSVGSLFLYSSALLAIVFIMVAL